MTGVSPERLEAAQRLEFFRDFAHQVHLGRCTRWPFGDCCPRHEEPQYFTSKDNDIASGVFRWLLVSGWVVTGRGGGSDD